MTEKHTAPDALDLDPIRRRAVAATTGPQDAAKVVACLRTVRTDVPALIDENQRLRNALHTLQSTFEYECPVCRRWGAWTDGRTIAAGDPRDEYWCQTCGEESPLADLRNRPAFSPARRAAAYTAILNLLAQHHPDAAATTTHGGTGEPRALADDAAAYTDAAINALVGGA